MREASGGFGGYYLLHGDMAADGSQVVRSRPYQHNLRSADGAKIDPVDFFKKYHRTFATDRG